MNKLFKPVRERDSAARKTPVIWCSTLLVVVFTGRLFAAEDVAVSGRVVNADGKPSPGVEVAEFWTGSRSGEMKAYRSARTGVDGRFTISIPGWRQETALLALDSDRKRGGLVVVPVKKTTNAGDVKLGPTVVVTGRFECKELGRKPTWTNVYVNLAKNRLIGSDSSNADFGFVLPAGDYKFNGYGADVLDVYRDLKLSADQAKVDMGVVDLPASVIAKHVGKAPPPWHVKEARGLRKEVTVADFKGKWVLVDFWGHWCGPCVHGMPDLIDLYETYADHRDKFEIIAFHDSSVDSLAAMDAKLVDTKERVWDGKGLPFPVLLDDEKKTVKAYTINAFPTTLLIDPDGKLVGSASAKSLEEKLPTLPPGVRAARTLDRGITTSMPDGLTLNAVVNFMDRFAGLKAELDQSSLKAKGVDSAKVVPLQMSGRISTRSWLNLLLTPDGLTYKLEGDVLRIVEGPRPVDSPKQKATALRLNKLLDAPVELDGKERTLAQLTKYLEDRVNENFVLDPAARRRGTLDPNQKVAVPAKAVSLRLALKQMLDPIGKTISVRDEVIVIKPRE